MTDELQPKNLVVNAVLKAEMKRLLMAFVLDYLAIFRGDYNDWRAAVTQAALLSRPAWVPPKPKHRDVISTMLKVVWACRSLLQSPSLPCPYQRGPHQAPCGGRSAYVNLRQVVRATTDQQAHHLGSLGGACGDFKNPPWLTTVAARTAVRTRVIWKKKTPPRPFRVRRSQGDGRGQRQQQRTWTATGTGDMYKGRDRKLGKQQAKHAKLKQSIEKKVKEIDELRAQLIDNADGPEAVLKK
ncbi:hypothetical protein B484DRAFT_438095, partial [Ochromonadaceae sp. CCMP2298]